MKNVKPKWMEIIPKGWVCYRIKDVTSLSPGFSNGGPEPTEEVTVVPMESVSENGHIDVEEKEEYALTTDGLTKFEKGDVLFAKITPCMENGKGAFVEHLPTKYAVGTTEFHVLRPQIKVDGKFLYYYTFNPIYREYAEANMKGAAGQKRVSSRFLNYTNIYLPGTNQQKIIAKYLEKATARIDKAINTKQKQLENLDELRKSIIRKTVTRGLDISVKLKKSGVMWVNEKPAHWRTVRIKDVVDFFNTIRIPLSAEERGWMTEKKYDYYGASGVIDKVDEYLFDGTFILLAEDGANLITRSSPLAFLAQGKFWVNNHAHIIKPRFDNELYLTHLLESLEYVPHVTGAAQPKLTKDNLGNIKIILPNKSEQALLSDYIEKRTSELYKIRSNIVNQVNNIEHYRKSLIHECVTGIRRISPEDLENV